MRVNGVRTKKNVVLAAGDVLDFYIEKQYKDYLPDVGLLYEDEGLLIFNKPPGLSCLEDKPDGKPTLLSVAEEYMKEHGDYDPAFHACPLSATGWITIPAGSCLWPKLRTCMKLW